MDKQQYKKLSVEFPAEEYVYLKMACAKKGVSLKDFVNQAVIKSIEEYEDELDVIALRKSREDNEASIPWEEVKREMGWDKL